jgi:GNAT superfamily N-acetyltransferase
MIIIRQATIEDVPAVAYLFDQYRQFYHQKHDLESAREFLSQRIKLKESVILVALIEGELAGFTQLYPIFSSVSMKKAWLLNDLFVEAKQRGKGVATNLLEGAKQVGRDSHAKWLLLQTGQDNLIAHTVYEKNGWVLETDKFYRFDIPAEHR